MSNGETCAHCGGSKVIRNPTGTCDHLLWPEMLTDEAKRANGLVLIEVTRREWHRQVKKAGEVTDF